MPKSQLSIGALLGRLGDRRVAAPFLIVALQSIAAFYFMYDGVNDMLDQWGHGFSLELAMECVAAIALVGGVVVSSRYVAVAAREPFLLIGLLVVRELGRVSVGVLIRDVFPQRWLERLALLVY